MYEHSFMPPDDRDPLKQLAEAESEAEKRRNANRKQGTRYAGLSRGLVRTRGKMNRTESRYARELDIQIQSGDVVDYWFEPFSLKLTHPDSGKALFYTPDFLVLLPSGITFIDDVKGGQIDDAALVRIRVAAEKFTLWRFRLVQLIKRDWKVREV